MDLVQPAFVRRPGRADSPTAAREQQKKRDIKSPLRSIDRRGLRRARNRPKNHAIGEQAVPCRELSTPSEWPSLKGAVDEAFYVRYGPLPLRAPAPEQKFRQSPPEAEHICGLA